jgi:hypothetical protein
MKPLLYSLLLGGSSFVFGTLLGTSEGLRFAEEDSRKRAVAALLRGSGSPMAASAIASDAEPAAPTTVIVLALYRGFASLKQTVVDWFNDLSAPSLQTSASKKSGGGDNESMSRRELLLLLSMSLAGCVCLFQLADSLGSSNRRHGSAGSIAVADGDDDDDNYALFGHGPGADYDPQSINLATPTTSVANSSLPLCIICARVPRDTVIRPCQHVVCCWTCAQRLVQHANMNAGTSHVDCPVCRQPVRKFDYLHVA